MSFSNSKSKFSAAAAEFIPTFLKKDSSDKPTSEPETKVSSFADKHDAAPFQPSKIPTSTNFGLVSGFNNSYEQYTEQNYYLNSRYANNMYYQQISPFDNQNYPYSGYSYPAYGPSYAVPAYHVQADYPYKGSFKNQRYDYEARVISIGTETNEANGVYKMVPRNTDIIRFSMETLLSFCPKENEVPDMDLPACVKKSKNSEETHKGKKKSKNNKNKDKSSSSTTTTTVRNPNAWVPSVFSKKVEDPNMVVLSQLKTILNKITPDNFSNMVKKTKELKVNEETIVRQCMDLIVRKAIKEPAFGELYARYILEISNTFYQPKETSNNTTFSSVVMIFKCVLNIIYSRLNYDEERLKIDFPDDTPNEAYRWSLIGICLFIGELYKKSVFTIDDITKILTCLLEKNSLCYFVETACKLLSCVGSFVEKNEREGKKIIKKYLLLLESHFYREDLETRFKVYICNVLEDSVNQWVPRRKDFDPKTLDEFYSSKNIAPTTTKKGRKIVQPVVKRTEYIFSHKQDHHLDSTPNNSNSISVSISSTSELFTPIQTIRKYILLLSTKANANTYRNIIRSTSSTEENNTKIEVKQEKQKAMTEEAIRKELEMCVKEYFSINNYNELTISVDDLAYDNKYTLLVFLVVYISLDKKEKEREMAVDLIQYLYIYSKCTVEGIISSLLEIHSDMFEICIDIPKAKSYFSTMLTKLIENNDIKQGIYSQKELSNYLTME